MMSPIYTVCEAVQHRVGRAWRNAWVEEIIDPGCVRVRLATGDRQTVTLSVTDPTLRKHGEKTPAVPRGTMQV